MDLAGRKAGVMGLGLSGEASARFLLRAGARVAASDIRSEAELGALPESLRDLGAEVETGGHGITFFEDCEIVVLSPGIRPDMEPLERARRAGARVISEVELASWFLRGRIAGVTGSNGKSTVTALAASMLRASGIRARACGNIGLPLIALHGPPAGEIHVKDLGSDECLGGDEKDAVYVAELSSFQLEAIDSFRPVVAALLNLSPDHQDRYARPEDYYEAKARIFMNQSEQDVAVLNADDPATWALAKSVRARLHSFTQGRGGGEGVRVRDGVLVHVSAGRETTLMEAAEIHLPGRHGRENVAAAATVAMSMGATAEGIRSATAGFEGLPHRLQLVAKHRGVLVYDDSKATNVGSTLRAVEAFDAPIILMLGGRDKGGDFEELAARVAGRIKTAVTFGEAGAAIAERVAETMPVIRSGSLEEAARAALGSADPGDVVLLSPACASFDAFTGYAARGEAFTRIVQGISSETEPR